MDKRKKNISVLKIKELIQKGFSISKIAKFFNCDYNTIKTRINKNNIYYKKQNKKQIDKEILINLINQNYSINQISNILKIDNNTINKKIKEYDIKYSNPKSKNIKKEEIEELLLKNYSIDKIAKYFNCGRGTILKKIKNYNIEYKSKNNIINLDKNVVEQFVYNNLDKNAIDISKFFNCGHSTILQYFKKNNIKYENKKHSTSQLEREIFKHLNDTTIILNDRKILEKKEIDILNHIKKFGIEVNGIMWHSFGKHKSTMFNNDEDEKNKKNNHIYKTIEMEKLNYQLFHIQEDEWFYKKEIWKSILNSKMNKTDRIFARNTKIITNIKLDDIINFQNKNHMQGYRNSSICIGLEYNNILVAIMTFSKSVLKDIDYEIIRFCNILNTTIVGGASKLLKYFERNFLPKSLVSYADRRWSQGNLYKKLGFDFVSNSIPNYKYFKPSDNNMIMYSRQKFQKHKLSKKLLIFNNLLSETINMYNNGYRKIYDCGSKKYIKYYKEDIINE